MKIGVYGKSCCANNDRLDVYSIEGDKETHIGFAVKIATYCGFSWEIRTKEDEIKYAIKNSSCSAASCCRLPCGYCKEATFEIKEPAKTETYGLIKKVDNSHA